MALPEAPWIQPRPGLTAEAERTDAAATAYASARTLAQQLNDPAADAALLVGLADIERTRGGSTAAALAQQARERANSPAGQASALVLQARIALLEQALDRLYRRPAPLAHATAWRSFRLSNGLFTVFMPT